jgi:hypothetical protein
VETARGSSGIEVPQIEVNAALAGPAECSTMARLTMSRGATPARIVVEHEAAPRRITEAAPSPRGFGDELARSAT